VSWPICQLLAAAEIQGRVPNLEFVRKYTVKQIQAAVKSTVWKNSHSTAVQKQKIKNSPVILEPREEWQR
jgi:hypothetical protein